MGLPLIVYTFSPYAFFFLRLTLGFSPMIRLSHGLRGHCWSCSNLLINKEDLFSHFQLGWGAGGSCPLGPNQLCQWWKVQIRVGLANGCKEETKNGDANCANVFNITLYIIPIKEISYLYFRFYVLYSSLVCCFVL